MFHMLSCFDLKPGEEPAVFASAYAAFVAEMQRLDLVVAGGPLGRRQRDTPMDTDAERDHGYFVLLSFRDRPQSDAAYAYIKRHVEPGDTAHESVYTRIENPVFICWQDLDSEGSGAD